MTGREFFDTHRENDDKCRLLQKMDEQVLLSWEGEPVSGFSPGIVDNSEYLYQQIVDPTHIAPDGEGLKLSAFDVCRSHGLSTQRIDHTNVDALIETGVSRADDFNAKFPDRPKKKLWGFIPYKVSDVREIVPDSSDSRALYVFDTADEDNVPHAEICQGGVNSSSRAQWKDVRATLYLMAKRKLLTVDELKASTQP